MDRVYIAGSLFTKKQIKQRLEDENTIKKILPNAEVFNPITQPFNDKSAKKPTPSDIFWGDTNAIIKSNLIIIDGDDIDFDSGVAVETGIAFGINYMLGIIADYVTDDIFDEILSVVPYKYTVTTISDIRQDTKGEEGLEKSWGHNLYTYGALLETGDVFRKLEDAKDIIKEISFDE